MAAMRMERAILWIMALGAVVGGLDRLFGNRLGLGERFEAGFQLLGPTALSMAGILCLTPVLSALIGAIAEPLCAALGFDPAMLAGVLAIDMGGYPLAGALAHDPRVGRYAGVLVAATLGCTVTFTVPVGMGMLSGGDRCSFARGMLYGLAGLPAGLAAGGLLSGLPAGVLAVQSLPVLALSLLLVLGLRFAPEGMVRGFAAFAAGLRALTTLGLIAGAVAYMTDWEIPGLAPIEDAMATVASIGVAMLGSLPAAELLRRALKRPLAWLGARTGMNAASAAGLLVGAVSVLPAVAMLPEMDARGKVVNAAAMVCSASALAAHLGFVAGVDAAMIAPLLATKLLGGTVGAAVALLATRRNPAEASQAG